MKIFDEFDNVVSSIRENDTERQNEYKKKLLEICEHNGKEFVDKGVKLHAIISSTLGKYHIMTPKNNKFCIKDFIKEVLCTFMKRHNISFVLNSYKLDIGDSVELKVKGNDFTATYIVTGADSKTLYLERTATMIEEYKGQKIKVKRSSKRLLYGMRQEKAKTKNYLFFFFD